MGLPNRLLLDGEKIILDLRPHWWFYFPVMILGVPVLAFVGFAATLDGDTGDAVKYLSYAVLAVWLTWLLVRMWQWSTTHFVVSTERIIWRAGLIAKNSRDIPLDRINDIASTQSIFERMLRSGHLLIESAGEKGQQDFKDISHVDRVQKEIHKQVEAHEERERFGHRGPASDGSVPDQIAALAALRDSGVLTEAEFAAKKADLLNRM
ncbi:MAG: PH domain-containing protein [Sporichthyaceae bacterium]